MPLETEITDSQEWIRIVKPSGKLEFWRVADISPLFVKTVNPLLEFTIITGFGVHDGWGWYVYATQDEADEAYEYAIENEGRVYSAEAA